jgi:cell division protein FtsB
MSDHAQLHERVRELEAENAALKARIKELTPEPSAEAEVAHEEPAA